MLRKLALLILAVGLVGCVEEAEERQILRDYVNAMSQMDAKNRQVAITIEQLRKPIAQISERDLAEARQLINDYVTQLQGLVPGDLDYSELRETHNRYVSKVMQAIELSGDKGRAMQSEKSNVYIGVRHIEKLNKQHYNTIDILWLRQKISDPYPLQWPSD